jgi:hypothetical protein
MLTKVIPGSVSRRSPKIAFALMALRKLLGRPVPLGKPRNRVVGTLVSRQRVRWILIGGAVCLFALQFIPFGQPGNTNSASSSPTISSSPSTIDNRAASQDTGVVQNPVVPSQQSELEQKQLLPLPPPDEAAVETHRKMVVGLNAKIREETRTLYSGAFEQLGLPANLQEKIIDILTKQRKQLEQQAFDAASSGRFPTPPSPEAIREQQSQQDQELRSVLGDAGFAQFNEYRATIPDRTVIGQMNQEGANLSGTQSQQLLQILTQARQQIIGQSGITQSLSSLPPDQAMTVIQEQEALLSQTVNDRTQSILTPDQTTLLQGVLSHRGVGLQKPSP